MTLTFSRRAAGELRARIARRLQRTVRRPLAWTFHGFGFSLVGELLVPDDLGRALRLLSGPEQEVVVRELLAHDRELGGVAWPEHARRGAPHSRLHRAGPHLPGVGPFGRS